LFKKVGVADIQFRKLGGANRREEAIQGEVGRQGNRLVAIHFVVSLLGIAALGAVHGGFGQSCFDAQHALGGLRRLLGRLARQRKHLRHVVGVVLADIGHVRVVFDVVIAVRQGEAALVDVGDHVVGIVQVGVGIEVEQRARSVHVHLRDLVDQRAFVFDCGHAIQFRLERSHSLLVDRLLVHAGAVEVANLLIDAVTAGTASGSFLQNAALDTEIAFVEFGKALPRRPVGGNFRVLHPVAASVLIEVHARVGALIDVVDAEAGGRFRRRRGLSKAANGGADH
jgi:hypothetical protein